MITNQDLEFVRNYSKRKRARDEILDRIRERVDVHSVQYDKILAKGGEARDRFAEHAAAVDELERRYRQDIEKYKAKYMELVNKIDKLPSDEMKLIKLRYQFAMPWRKVRQRMHYSEREVYNIHKRALEHLEEME